MAQQADPVHAIIIKGGHVIDPKNNVNEVMDVAIDKAGKIAAVSKNIDPKSAARVVDARGLIVTPGIIDMHTHNFAGTEPDKYLRNSYFLFSNLCVYYISFFCAKDSFNFINKFIKNFYLFEKI